MNEQNPAPAGVVSITRLPGSRDSDHDYEIFVDSKRVNSIAENETVELPLPRGRHSIRLKVDRIASSGSLTVDVPDGELTVFCCSGSADRFDLDVWRPHRYIQIGRATDRARMRFLAEARQTRNRLYKLILLAQGVGTIAAMALFPAWNLIQAASVALLAPTTVWLVAIPVRLQRLREQAADQTGHS